MVPRLGSAIGFFCFLLSLQAFLLASTFAVSAARGGELQPSAEAYQKWAKDVTKKHSLQLCRFGTFQYDLRQLRGFFSLFKKPVGSDEQFILLVSWENTHRTFATEKIFNGPVECPGTQPDWESGKDVRLGPWGEQPKEFSRISVVDGNLVLLGKNDEDAFQSSGTDWEAPGSSSRNYEDKTENVQAFLLILDSKSPWRLGLPRPQNWVIFGAAAHKGPTDAAINVSVTAVGSALRVDLAATDDVLRPPPERATDAAFIKSDHFELWFCAPNQEQDCGKKQARQLGVAKLANGKAQARWLHPKGSKEHVPLTAVEGGDLVVTIPLDRIQHIGSADDELEGKLTAVYSDSDTEGKGQETVVATSKLRWAVSESFGQFIRHENGGRFPKFTRGAGFSPADDLLAPLPRPPW